MEGIGRKADGRRIFSVECKRQVVGQVVSGEKTLAELSRELEIHPAVLRNWMRLVERGGTAAVAAGEDVVPASRARELEQQVKDLQRLVGKQAMTIEILEATRDLVRKIHTCSEHRYDRRDRDHTPLQLCTGLASRYHPERREGHDHESLRFARYAIRPGAEGDLGR